MQLNLARTRSGAGPQLALLCVHGMEDKYFAHEQAVWLIDKLKAATVEAVLFEFFEKRLKK